VVRTDILVSEHHRRLNLILPVQLGLFSNEQMLRNNTKLRSNYAC
jgi:hypothetical protein